MQPALFSKGTRLCVDLRRFATVAPDVTAAQYWPAAGVELVDCDLAVFVDELSQELEAL
jgi:hypothetical protein